MSNIKQTITVALGSRYAMIWYATIALFVISGLTVRGSLTEATLRTLLPFAGALMIAATGQFLVIQAGGMDLSVPGVMALSAMIVTCFPITFGMNVWLASVLAIVACCASGLLSGLIVVYLRFSPIVSTLAINALLVGLVLLVTGGFAYTAQEELVNFASGSIFGVPAILAIALVLMVIVAVTLRQTSVGRRLVATGANQRAARAMGIPVRRYTVCSYVAAGFCFGIVGVLLSGLLRIPGSVVGATYLFTTFGAVVLGGSPLLGGEGSIVSTVIGALFLTQLNQMVLNAGGSTATQNLIQGGVIAISLLIAAVNWRALFRIPKPLQRSIVQQNQ